MPQPGIGQGTQIANVLPHTRALTLPTDPALTLSQVTKSARDSQAADSQNQLLSPLLAQRFHLYFMTYGKTKHDKTKSKLPSYNSALNLSKVEIQLLICHNMLILKPPVLRRLTQKNKTTRMREGGREGGQVDPSCARVTSQRQGPESEVYSPVDGKGTQTPRRGTDGHRPSLQLSQKGAQGPASASLPATRTPLLTPPHPREHLAQPPTRQWPSSPEA